LAAFFHFHKQDTLVQKGFFASKGAAGENKHNKYTQKAADSMKIKWFFVLFVVLLNSIVPVASASTPFQY
jgi:hypothetical protein